MNDRQLFGLGLYIGIDGLFTLALFLVAGLLLRRSVAASVCLVLAGILRVGDIGLTVGWNLGFSSLVDLVGDLGLYGLMDYLWPFRTLLRSLAAGAQWGFLVAAVFVGRAGETEVVPEASEK